MAVAPPVGIDLGTTNTVVAYVNDLGRPEIIPSREGRPTMPSVVAFPEPGRHVVGDAAREYLSTGLCPVAAFFKQEMGDAEFRISAHEREYSAVELSSLVLDAILVDAAEFLGRRPERGVITVPAYFREAERSATIEAAQRVGFEAFQTINEPTAAAIAYGSRISDAARQVLVYDLGGGTFDVTVLSMGQAPSVRASTGDYSLGGKDWDHRLFDHIANAFQDQFGVDPVDGAEDRLMLQEQIESAKARLSRATEARLSIRAQGQQRVFQITRRQFEDMTRDLLSRTMALVEDLLTELALTPGDIDKVLLVGGSTRMPMVSQVLGARFPDAVDASLNPDEAVAIGAALLARQRAEEIGPAGGSLRVTAPSNSAIRIRDVTTHSLGMIAVSADGSRYLNSVILPRNQAIPCRSVRSYSHRFDAVAGALEIFLTQGEAEGPQDVSYLGHCVIDGLPGAEPGQAGLVEIAYAYDESAIVRVQARAAGQEQWTSIDRGPLPDDVPERFLEAPGSKSPGAALTVYIVVDVSGSMQGAPLAEAKAAAHSFLSEMDLRATSVGIIAVSDRAEVLLPASADESEIKSAIDALKAGLTGYANRADPFVELLGLLQDVKGPKAGIVLADGIWSRRNRAIKRAKACHAAGIEISGIGFGSADQSFLDAISSTDALSILTTQDGLTRAFLTIAQELNQRAGIRMR